MRREVRWPVWRGKIVFLDGAEGSPTTWPWSKTHQKRFLSFVCLFTCLFVEYSLCGSRWQVRICPVDFDIRLCPTGRYQLTASRTCEFCRFFFVPAFSRHFPRVCVTVLAFLLFLFSTMCVYIYVNKKRWVALVSISVEFRPSSELRFRSFFSTRVFAHGKRDPRVAAQDTVRPLNELFVLPFFIRHPHTLARARLRAHWGPRRHSSQQRVQSRDCDLEQLSGDSIGPESASKDKRTKRRNTRLGWNSPFILTALIFSLSPSLKITFFHHTRRKKNTFLKSSSFFLSSTIIVILLSPWQKKDRRISRSPKHAERSQKRERKRDREKKRVKSDSRGGSFFFCLLWSERNQIRRGNQSRKVTHHNK